MMRKIIFATGLILFAVVIKAQQPQAPKPPGMEERLKRTNEMLQKEVQPTPAQTTAMESVFKNFFTAADQLRKDNPPPPPDPKVKAAMDQLAKERDESIKKILTEAQFKKYVEAEKTMRPPRPGEPKGPNGAPPPPPKN